jgi:hypothetical protein
MQAFERKKNLTCNSDLNEGSVEEPAMMHKTNVFMLQKELVNKSNQKIQDLANLTGHTEEDEDEAAEFCNSYLFNQSVGNVHNRTGELWRNGNYINRDQPQFKSMLSKLNGNESDDEFRQTIRDFNNTANGCK